MEAACGPLALCRVRSRLGTGLGSARMGFAWGWLGEARIFVCRTRFSRYRRILKHRGMRDAGGRVRNKVSWISNSTDLIFAYLIKIVIFIVVSV